MRIRRSIVRLDQFARYKSVVVSSGTKGVERERERERERISGITEDLAKE